MVTVKDDATLLDMAIALKQQQHLKKNLKAKIPTPIHFLDNHIEEDPLEDKIFVVNNYRNFVKTPPYCVSMKVRDKIPHCCLVNGGSRPNFMHVTHQKWVTP